MTISTPAPKPTPDSEGFWIGLAERELRIPRCNACGSYFFPVMPGCPDCSAEEGSVELVPVSGKGRIFSWFVARHAFHPAFVDELPYVVLEVELDEGPRIYGRLAGDVNQELEANMPVEAQFEDVDDFTRLAFARMDSTSHRQVIAKAGRG